MIEAPSHDAKRKAPVLFVLHAYSTPSELLVQSFSLAETAGTKRGFLLVVPDGTKDDDGQPYWNASRACCGNTRAEVDDLGYLRGVLGDLKTRYAVDDTRVYAIGVSNGAFMAHAWACASADLAGIAAISGVGPGPEDSPCKPGRAVRVFQIHGDHDDVIRYEGGQGSKGRYPSAAESTKRWADLNGCHERLETASGYSLLHGRTKREEWRSSKPCVALWTFEGGGHQLRSVRFASSEIIEFLDGDR